MSLIWQQLGRRRTLLVNANSEMYAEIAFDLQYGISPFTFRGYTDDAKKLPVKLNGALDTSFEPSVSKKTRRLRIVKAVKDYYILFSVTNMAIGSIDVKWMEDGKQQTLVIPFQGTRGRSVLFKDRLRVNPVIFEAFLSGTNQRVKLNKRNRLQIVPQTYIKKQLFIAEKEYYVTVNIINQIADDIEVKWNQFGFGRSFIVLTGETSKKTLSFSGPVANAVVNFEATVNGTNAKVKLNGLDVVAVLPTLDSKAVNMVASAQYHLILLFNNSVQGDVVVSWMENGVKKTTELVTQTDKRLDLIFKGVNANRPIAFTAKLKEFDKIIQLNGKDELLLQPALSRDLITVLPTERYYLDLDIINDAAKDIIVWWVSEKERKSVNIARGESKEVNLVFDGINSVSSIKLEAFIKDTDERVNINEKSSLSFAPLRRRNVIKVTASKEYFLDLEVENQVDESIEVHWVENGKMKSQKIAPYTTALISLTTTGQNADNAIEFSATLQGGNHTVELDERRAVKFMPRINRRPIRVTAAVYKIRFVNQALGNAVIKWRVGETVLSLNIPSKAAKETYLDFNKQTDLLVFSGINEKSNTSVLINGTQELTLFKDSRRLIVSVNITDGKFFFFLPEFFRLSFFHLN